MTAATDPYGWGLPLSGDAPIQLNPPSDPDPLYADIDDWVSGRLYLDAGPGALPYVVTPEAWSRYANAVWRVGPNADALARFGRESSPVLGFRAFGQASRPRWAVVDWSSSPAGVRPMQPRAALATLVCDLDRLDALASRARLLAESPDAGQGAGQLNREADALAEFRTHLREANLQRLSSLWAESLPPTPSEPPTRPAVQPVRLR